MGENLGERIAQIPRPDSPAGGGPPGSSDVADAVVSAYTDWVADRGLTLYPAQEEALLELVTGSHVIVNTPTGSGKSLIAIAAHAAALAEGRRTYYTAPIKALVSERFFDLASVFGADRVGMVTGDASVNQDAPIVCATAEIVANMALRHGADAPIDQVVMDEFHYIADPDRGWAWQVPLLELPHTQFLLLSATLGDVTRFEQGLVERTHRPVSVVRSAQRPVPLEHRFSMVGLTEVIEELLATGGAPAYLVHFTQAGAAERAQALTSLKLCTREEKDAIAEEIAGFRFATGFGRTLSRFVRQGIGVHHAGMLPRYRRLVERLAQAGLLKVICGTDTLGVGINVPIRTVVLTSLSKYDGTSTRLLTAREFHQISGRAGRAGYDTKGEVVVQAPDHVIENARMEAKAGDDPKKRRKLVKKKPPEGTVSWGRPTFERLVAAEPEPLTTHLSVTHSMLLEVLDRSGDGRAALHRLLTDNYDTEADCNRHVARAEEIYASLLAGGVIEELDDPDEKGRTVRVTVELQADFALNQPLAPFALAALDLPDPEAPTHALDVVSVIESVLDGPRQVLAAQTNRARAAAIAAMKAEGLDYEERMARLEDVTHPRPLAELLEPAFEIYRQTHPWVADHPLTPKSIVRDMFERAMDFGDYVRHYELTRVEGTLLRYLSDAYRTLARTIPEDSKTPEIEDITAWLGEMVRQVDSSLVTEWEALTHPEELLADPEALLEEEPPPVTSNRRAFTILVRNALFQRVELAARRQWGALADLDRDDGWDEERWFAAFEPYFAEHGSIGIGPDARSASMVAITEEPDRWVVHQIIEDPEGHHEWRILAEVDLAASDETGTAEVTVLGVGRADELAGLTGT